MLLHCQIKFGEYYQETSLENYVAQINVGSEILNLLVLEFGAREEVLEWASDYVKTHNDERFILITHEWLSESGIRIDTGSSAEQQFGGLSSYTTPEVIWNRLVRSNNNIICVLSGHERGFSHFYLTENDFGRQVPQILFNLQFLPNGGDGIVQVWKIADKDTDFEIFALDTKTGEKYLPDSTSYHVPFRYVTQNGVAGSNIL